MSSELNTFLMALREAINIDSNQFDRAKKDSMYADFRTEVNDFLDNMYKEVKTNAEREFSEFEYSIEKMKKWSESEYSEPENIRKYEEVLSNIHNAKEKFKNRNYVNYVDAVNIMNEARKIKDEIHASIENNLDLIEKELNHNKTVLNDYYNRKDRLIRIKKTGLYKRIIIAWGLVIAMVLVMVMGFAAETYDSSYGFFSPSESGLLILICLSLSFAALIGYLDKSLMIIGAVVGGFIAMIITGIILYVIKYLISDAIATIFFELVIFVFIVWPFVIPDDTKSKISKLENDEKAIKELISILSHKIQISREAILSPHN